MLFTLHYPTLLLPRYLRPLPLYAGGWLLPDASIRHENNTLALTVGRKTLDVCRRCSGLNGLHSPSCALAFDPSSPFASPEHSEEEDL